MPPSRPSHQRNILGGPLQKCSRPQDPITGWNRDGYASYHPSDYGCHIIAAELTLDFLLFTKSRGNPLYQPPWYIRWFIGFQGLNPGDRWALCASRWKEAYDAGKACGIVAEATHEKALEFVDKKILIEYAIDIDESRKKSLIRGCSSMGQNSPTDIS